jgi:phospholipid/cholesterol/gamma-HCH transport system substrate-binding protein
VLERSDVVAQKTNHWKLGLFVVSGLAIALGAIIALGLDRLNRDAFPVVTYFDESVQGLDVGSPVKFRGVTLGNVSTITVAPDHRHVEVWMRIYKDESARMGFDPEAIRDPYLRPQLAAAGITGVRFVQFDTFPPDRYPEPALGFEPPERYYMASVPSTLKSLEEVANEVLAKLPGLSDQVGDTLKEAKRALRTLSEVARWVQGDAGVKKVFATLEETARSLDAAIRDAELARTTGAMRVAADSVNDAAGKLGGQTGQLEETMRALREALEAVRSLAARLERDPSAVIRGRNVPELP